MNGCRILNVGLSVLLVIVLVGGWLMKRDTTRRNWLFLPEMVHSVAAESFDANDELPDGMVEQAPVPGTVMRGQMPLHYAATPEDAKRAGEELTNPLAKKPRQGDLTRGAVAYDNFCMPCHGQGGRGDGPVAQRGFPPPPSLLADKSKKMKDGELFHIITYGLGNMAPYAPHLSRLDRWKVILHIRSLQAKK